MLHVLLTTQRSLLPASHWGNPLGHWKLVMFPKLFRRLADYFAETEGGLAAINEWVRNSDKRDDKLIFATRAVGNLHDVYEVKSNRILLRIQPKDVDVIE